MNTPSFIFHVFILQNSVEDGERILFATIITSICIAGKKLYKKAEDL